MQATLWQLSKTEYAVRVDDGRGARVHHYQTAAEALAAARVLFPARPMPARIVRQLRRSIRGILFAE